MAKLPFQQGDVVLIPYPYTDLSSVKRRPVVIISKDSINKDFFIVAKITSVIRRDNLSFGLQDSDLESPLPKESEVRTNEVFTAHKSLIVKTISKVLGPALSLLTEQIKSNISVA